MVETYSPSSRHRIAMARDAVDNMIRRMTAGEILMRAAVLEKLMRKIGRLSDADDLQLRRANYVQFPTPPVLERLAFEVCWAESWL